MSMKVGGYGPDGCTCAIQVGDCPVHSKLDAIADLVLAYRPVGKSKPARRRKRRRMKLERQKE